MRGGLDDALDKLARRDQLRRRSSGEAPGTPAAVTELVEAIAAVIGRHPGLGVSVGVEGAGDPLLLHFFFADGQVQVNAENAVTPPGEPGAPRHADFDAEVDEPYSGVPFDYPQADPYQADSDTAERQYGSFDDPPSPAQHPGESSRDLGARMRDLGMASTRAEAAYPPHPFAPTPPPEVPPQATRRIPPEHYNAPAEPPAAERIPTQPGAMPAPLPKPIPLQVERPEETEMNARRLAAMLRDDPSLLEHPQ